MCHCAEMYICLRSKFITSYSVLSICHWILGISDRHLNNTILSKRTGHCIGIDFNFVFHTATSIQVVPELIPFRTSPHIVINGLWWVAKDNNNNSFLPVLFFGYNFFGIKIFYKPSSTKDLFYSVKDSCFTYQHQDKNYFYLRFYHDSRCLSRIIILHNSID